MGGKRWQQKSDRAEKEGHYSNSGRAELPPLSEGFKTEAETRDWRAVQRESVSQGATTIWICGLYRHGLRREVFRSFSISSVFARRRGGVRTRRGRAGIPAENRRRETYDVRTAFTLGAKEVAPGQYGGHAPGSLRGAGSGVDGERAARRGGG